MLNNKLGLFRSGVGLQNSCLQKPKLVNMKRLIYSNYMIVAKRHDTKRSDDKHKPPYLTTLERLFCFFPKLFMAWDGKSHWCQISETTILDLLCNWFWFHRQICLALQSQTSYALNRDEPFEANFCLYQTPIEKYKKQKNIYNLNVFYNTFCHFKATWI